MHERIRFSLLVAVMASFPSVSPLAQAAGKSDTAISALVGTWRLVSWKAVDSTGAEWFPMGPAAEGRLSYDAQGNMSGHLMKPNRPRFVSPDWGAGSDAETRAAFSGYFGYYGRYTLDASHGTVTHHVEGASFPNFIGTDQVRYFELDGDRLTIKTPLLFAAGRQLPQTLVWTRVR